MKGKVLFILITLAVCGVSANIHGNALAASSVIFPFAKPAVITEEAVWNQLKELKDPQFVTLAVLSDSLSVVDMGLIYSVQVENNNVRVVLTTYHPGFVQYIYIASPVRQKILAMTGVGAVTVEYVREPVWTPDRLSQKARDVLLFESGDPVEGRLHVRSKLKADPNAKPYDERKLDRSHLVIPASAWGVVDTLSAGRLANWRGWRYFKRFEVEEGDGLARQGEPIQVDVAFDGSQVIDLAKEIRVLEEASENEIPSQVYGEVNQGSSKSCTVIFKADASAREKKGYLILYGNSSSDLHAPSYVTDLMTTGEGFALEIENNFYKVGLSKVMGQLKSLQFKNGGKTVLMPSEDWSSGTKIDALNDPGNILFDLCWHGEDSCIHWGPDFKDHLRFRITQWNTPPNVTVIKGPVCTIVKRWGYPIAPIYPVFPQSDTSIEVTYVFYSGLPYFTMESRVSVEKETDINVVRNDEWVFLLPTFTDMVSMMDGGSINVFQNGTAFSKNPALLGFYNRVNGDGFASLHLAFDAIGFPNAYGPSNTSITPDYVSVPWQLWVRYAFDSNNVASGRPSVGIQPGATIGEYNAYLLYNAKDTGGNNQAKDWYNVLRKPLKASIPDYPTSVNEQEGSSTVPMSYSLSQNYPNPFNSSTGISFTLPEQGEVQLCVYNLAGQKVATLAQGLRKAGMYTVRWDGRDDSGKELASGVFLYQMRAGKQVNTRKLLLLR
ncbi:MAG: FlgD immunoglobulin-like domain containing protein [Candidatus Latescibacterota bacterium]